MIQTLNRDFLLEIPGLTGADGTPLRYYCGRTPEITAPTSSPGGVNFTDIKGIIGVSSISADIEEIGGVAEVSPVEVTLATGGALARSVDDPGFVLTRLGLREADWKAQIAGSTYAADDLTPLYIDQDPAPLTFPCWVQLGNETLLATAGAGSQPDPDVADPYRLTISARGAGGTQVQNHILRFRGAGKPTVTTPIVNWQGRRAILYRYDGRQYAQIMRGFISATPQISSDGSTISLGILPMMIRLDRELATDSQNDDIRLLDGWHYFEEDLYVDAGQVMPRSAGFGGNIEAALAPGGTLIDGASNRRMGQTHQGLFDISLPSNHPRAGTVVLDFSGEDATVTAYPVNDRDLTVAPVTGSYPIGTSVDTKAIGELIRATVSAGAVRVPDALVTTINGGGWAPGTKNGVSGAGAWFDLVLRPDEKDILVRWNATEIPRNRRMEVWLWGQAPRLPVGYYISPSSIKAVDGAGAETFPADPDERVYIGIDFRDPDVDPLPAPDGYWLRKIQIESDLNAQFSIPVREFCTSWYRPGDQYLFCDSNPFIPTDGLRVEIVHEGDDGEEVISEATIISSTAEGDGYLLELDSRSRRELPPIRNSVDRAEVVIEPARTTGGLTPGVILLQLLISGGDGSSTYDVLPVGAGLLEDEVDVASCLRLTPSVDGLWRLIIPKETPLRELIQGILLDCGAALVLRTGGDGVQRVTAVSIAPEVGTELRVALTSFSSTPAVQAIDDVKTAYEFRLDFRRDDAAQTTIRVEDPAAATLLGRQETLAIDMRGKILALPRSGSALAAVFPVAARLAEIYGVPRRRYTMSIAAEQLGGAGVGDVASITDPHVRGPMTERRRFGVEDLMGRLSRVSVDWWNGGAEVSMINYGGKRGGWAPSFEVTGIVDTTTVEVSLTTYGPSENPYSGEAQDDLTPFSEGQSVRAVVEVDSGTSYTLLIQTINRGVSPARVTFSTAHPYSGSDLGWVQPRDWDNAAAGHKLYAFMGDSAGTLGAATGEGFEIG